MPLTEKVRKAWVKALRSGKYVQGRGALRSFDDAFCCLGVLCDLTAKGRILSKPRGRWLPKSKFHEAYLGRDFKIGREAPVFCSLPDTLINAIGIDPEHVSELAEMNDSGKSFKAIATYIEKKKI